MKNNAVVMKIDAHMPKTYLIELMKGDVEKCPDSRIPKHKKVRNKNIHEMVLIFHIRLFLYAIAARINDNNQNKFERIT